ncbi:MAG TPA: YdcF family protein [Caulobacteraceae bacterium]
MKGLSALLIVVMIWGVGLLAFAARVEQSTPAPEPAAADGIVALTGSSVVRLAEATKLLEQGKGQRLLVSGVNRVASRADILEVTKAGKGVYDCCVDLGFMAADTLGNAQETAEWARAKNYKSLIVVTADFHMPRAMLELRAAMPDAKLTPYPVLTETLDTPNWWKTAGAARLMALEYCKYLAILGREALLSLGPKDDDKPKEKAA